MGLKGHRMLSPIPLIYSVFQCFMQKSQQQTSRQQSTSQMTSRNQVTDHMTSRNQASDPMSTLNVLAITGNTIQSSPRPVRTGSMQRQQTPSKQQQQQITATQQQEEGEGSNGKNYFKSLFFPALSFFLIEKSLE